MIKAQTSGLLYATNIAGVDLGPLVSLVPIRTPFRNSTARVSPDQGATYAYWRALLNVNSQQPNPAVGNDYGASALTVFDEVDVAAPYVPLRGTVRITEDAIDIAQGYANAVGLATIQAVNQLMIGEDRQGLMGQAYALPAISNTITCSTATTGGTIADSQAVYVKVAARSGYNYYYGGSGAFGTRGTVTAGSTGSNANAVTASVAAVKGAVAYDWYICATTGGVYYYYTTTTVNTVTITSVQFTTDQALPALPDLSSVAPIHPGPVGDTSYSANNMNGLLPSALGDYGSSLFLVTPGSGTNSGAYWASLDGSALSLSGAAEAHIDAMNASIWATAKVSPTRYLVNSTISASVANLILGSTMATTFLQPNDIAQRQNVVAGGALGWYLNKSVAGAAIKVEVHVNVPPGTLIAVCDNIDYPGANLDVPFRYRVQRDYTRFDYGANWVPSSLGGGPRQDIGFTVRETFENRAAPTQGVLSNIF
jgi:hypothetical protein